MIMPTTDITEFNPKRCRNSPDRTAVDSATPTKADIIDDIRAGLRQAKAGEGRPARLVLQEIRDELAADADNL